MNSKLINLALLLGSVLLLYACNTSTSRDSPPPAYHQVESFRQQATPSPRTKAVFTRRFSYSPGGRDGQTLHAIIVAATNASGGIADSVKKDLTNMVKLVREIAEETGLSLTGGSISGEDFTRSKVLAAINGLSVKSGDVVLFYNASHGLNSGGNSDWPAIYFPKEPELPLEEVAAMLKDKNPRLSMVLGDLCNNVYSRSVFATARTERGKTRNYQALFLNYAGDILASGSKKGQSSWGNPQVGGLFTYTFLNELDQELMVTRKHASWEALMGRVTDKPLPDAKETQQPQARVNVRLIGELPPLIDCERNSQVPECQIMEDPELCERNPDAPECRTTVYPPHRIDNSSSPFGKKFGW